MFQKKDGISLNLDDVLKETNMKQPFELLVEAEVEVMNIFILRSIHITMLAFKTGQVLVALSLSSRPVLYVRRIFGHCIQ